MLLCVVYIFYLWHIIIYLGNLEGKNRDYIVCYLLNILLNKTSEIH